MSSWIKVSILHCVFQRLQFQKADTFSAKVSPVIFDLKILLKHEHQLLSNNHLLNCIALLFWNYITNNISLTTYIIIMSMILDIYIYSFQSLLFGILLQAWISIDSFFCLKFFDAILTKHSQAMIVSPKEEFWYKL